MSKRSGVGVKLVFAFVLVAVMSVSLQIILLSRTVSRVTTADALGNLTAISNSYSIESKSFFDDGFELAVNLKSVLEGLQEDGAKQKKVIDRNTLFSIMEVMHKNNPWATGLWTAWEPDAFDNNDKAYAGQYGHDKTGRLIPASFTSGGETSLDPLVGYDQKGAGDFYLIPLNTKQEAVLEPYEYVGANGVTVLLTSMAVPIIQDGKVAGVSGVDVSLDYFKQQMSLIRPMEEGLIMLLSPGLQIVGHTDSDMVGQMLQDTPFKLFAREVEDVLASGRPLAEIVKQGWVYNQDNAGLAILPFSPGNTGQNWVVVTVVPCSRIMQTTNILMNSSLKAGFLALVLALIIGLFSVKIVVGGLTRNIAQVVTNLDDIATNVTDDVRQLSLSTDEISDGTRSAAAALDQISASLNEISSRTEETVERAKNTDLSARNTLASVDRSILDMASMNKAMDNINGSATRINDIIKTTEGIAFQINLLALNASVEAARAGEAGVGFAVVAEEVRNLAIRSADSASSTRELIDLTIKHIKGGLDATTHLEQGIHEIEDCSKEIVQLISEIKLATDQQHTGTTQVREALGVLNTVVNRSVGAVSEVADATKVLSKETEKMAPIFDILKRI